RRCRTAASATSRPSWRTPPGSWPSCEASAKPRWSACSTATRGACSGWERTMTDERDGAEAVAKDATATDGFGDEVHTIERVGEDGTPQARLYFERVGPREASTVYFLHGGPGYNASSFRELVGEELEAYDVIYADARGGGRSPGVLGSDVDVLA